MNSLTFKIIKKYLNDNSINIVSDSSDDEIFKNINSIDQAKNNELIFFNDTRHIESLKKTNARACLIERKFINYLPKSCLYVIVDNPYLAFTHLTNLFYKPTLSNGIISKYTSISNNSNISENVQINSFVTINENVTLKENVIIAENSAKEYKLVYLLNLDFNAVLTTSGT